MQSVKCTRSGLILPSGAGPRLPQMDVPQLRQGGFPPQVHWLQPVSEQVGQVVELQVLMLAHHSYSVLSGLLKCRTPATETLFLAQASGREHRNEAPPPHEQFSVRLQPLT